MKTLKEIKREKRRIQRQELKFIESILHPNPTVDGCEVVHEHRGQYIYFTVQKGNKRISDHFLQFHRQDILSCPEGYNFYKEQEDNIKFIIKEGRWL